MTCQEYRDIVGANEEVTEELADKMDEHDFQCNGECESSLYDMFTEILGVDPEIDPEELLDIGIREGWAG